MALAGLVLLGAGPARGDGDPASDTLIAQSVFYPYSTFVPSAARGTLDAVVAAAARSGVAVKVALIAHPSDLGSITALYGKPQQYATFLHTEISYSHAVRLLVVMPSGDGTAGIPAPLARAVAALAPAGSSTGTALVGAALRAIRRLTAGARTGAVGPAVATDTHQGRTVLLLGLILAAVLVSGAIVLLRLFFPPSPSPGVAAQTRSARGAGRKDRARARSRRRE
jgi:hypothetical protein